MGVIPPKGGKGGKAKPRRFSQGKLEEGEKKGKRFLSGAGRGKY